MPAATPRRCSWKSRSGRRRISRRWPRCASKGGLDIAAGENACTAYQFRQMMKAGAVSHAQPSVIKVGGITEFLKVAALGDELGVKIIPHSPYFGPGFLATLHLMSVRDEGLIEVFYMKRAACLWRGRIDADANGNIAVPQGPGPRLRAGPRRHGAIPGVVTIRSRRILSAQLRIYPSPPNRAFACAGAVAPFAGSDFFMSSAICFCAACRSAIDLLQPRDRRLQRLDLPVRGIELLLMIARQLGDRLLQEIDIALQAGGAAFHGLLDRADFDAGNVLRAKLRRYLRSRISDASAATKMRLDSSKSSRRNSAHHANCSRRARSARDITLIPHSGVVICSGNESGWGF